MARRGGMKLMFDTEAINELLRQGAPPILMEAANRVADGVRAKVPEDVPVTVRPGVGRNGRPYAMVQIEHASGLARQAKDGVLTRSAAEIGIDANRYPGATERGPR